MGKTNDKKIEELEQMIRSLESELAASMEREALLQNGYSGEVAVSFKEKFKRTKVGRVVADPRSSIGRIARLPRTFYRVIMYPDVAREVFKKKFNKNPSVSTVAKAEELFVPIKFFFDESERKRVNLVLKRIETEKLRMAIEMANREDAELRVVTCAEKVDPMKYREWVKQKKVPKAKQISFYSSYDQGQRTKIFELEIGKNEVFLTEAWKNNV